MDFHTFYRVKWTCQSLFEDWVIYRGKAGNIVLGCREMQSCDTETEPFTKKITVLIYSFRSEVLVFDISFFYNKLPYFMILRYKYFHSLASPEIEMFY